MSTKTTSTAVELFTCSVDRRGNIKLQATRAFMDVLRTKFGSEAGRPVRSGQFEFMQTGQNRYQGFPENRDDMAMAEAVALVEVISKIYAETCLFEQVFAKEGSYQNWMIFNRRAPQYHDLEQLAIKQGLIKKGDLVVHAEPIPGTRVRKMVLNLRPQKEAVVAREVLRVVASKSAEGQRPKFRVQAPVASESKLQSLVDAFKRPAPMRLNLRPTR